MMLSIYWQFLIKFGMVAPWESTLCPRCDQPMWVETVKIHFKADYIDEFN